MTQPAAEPTPLILTNASLMINDVELACVANHVEVSPDVSVTTLDTFCGSRDYPGTVKWSLIATLYQSFDTGATEETLAAAYDAYKADGTPATFRVCGTRDSPVGPTNPEWTGEAIPQPHAPINGDAGDASTVDLEWSVIGEPVKNVVPAP